MAVTRFDMTALKTKQKKKAPVGVSRLIGPEDIRPGIWVTVSETTYRGPAEERPYDGGSIATVTWTTLSCMAGVPYKVRAVALPFVYVTDAAGGVETLDLRRERLARLPSNYGRLAMKLARELNSSS